MPQGLNSTVITHWEVKEGTAGWKVKTSTCVLLVVCMGGGCCRFIVHVALCVLGLQHLFSCGQRYDEVGNSFQGETQHVHFVYDLAGA